MKKSDLVLIGAGGHARSCIDVIQHEGKYRIAGLIGSKVEVGNSQFGVEIIGCDENLNDLALQFEFAFIGVGQIKSPTLRAHLFNVGLTAGFEFPTVISPAAYVSPYARIGQGTIVMHGAIVNAGASVGENCIINSRALIEHDSNVGNQCHISTGAIINGGVDIEQGTFVGSGALVRNGVSIGRDSFIEMGAVVKGDLGPNSMLSRFGSEE
jgi:sugar O-acyltransferase (sialic acid O-acetyltransferase NeuD family)